MSRDGSSAVRTKRMEVEVEDCGRVYLMDRGDYEAADGSSDSQTHAPGLMRSEGRGLASLNIATQWGDIPFTVTAADRDPGADLDGYEDIGEMSFDAPSGEVFLAGWLMDWDDEKAHDLSPLLSGSRTYRLRYHIRGIDEERCWVDDHYLQIWPAPLHGPAVLKTTDEAFRHLLKPES
ncbi:hypothetical protein MTP10_00680 [Nonomuraea sp. 3-1Str]|uniref:hypothetical protein n=1 Tax=Nonomuraea sp. 3-1Str TaxID=2929801 RepID=UPI00285C198D|nr:hypothetical protein [Nonomuraea sp. 3-1Str]MDR8407252.1 hypothetical protein [Nonomuraea sp. 3-1Str]